MGKSLKWKDVFIAYTDIQYYLVEVAGKHIPTMCFSLLSLKVERIFW